MKTKLSLLILAAACLSAVSCGPYTREGAVAGGLVGAGTGAIIGHQSGRGLEGAAIGGALGAGAGALLGSARDDRYYGRGYAPPRRYYDSRRYHYRSYHRPRGYYQPRSSGYYRY